MKERVYSIAQDLSVSSSHLLKKCHELGISVKNHMSFVYDADIQALRRAVQNEKQEAPKEEVIAHGILRRRTVKPAAPPPPAAQKAAKASPARPAKAPAMAAAPQDAAAAAETQAPPVQAPSPSEPFGPRILGQIQLPAAPLPSPPRAQAFGEPRPQPADPSAGATPGRRFEVVKTEAKPWQPKGKKPRKKKVAPGTKVKKTEITVPKASKRVVRIEGRIQLQELAKAMSTKATELLMKLLQLGMSGININSTLDADTAKIVASEYNYEVEDVAIDEEGLIRSAVEAEGEDEDLVARPPIVTVMGHVDHGKTTLLDYIRNTKVAAGEAGGITQAIGASAVETPKGIVVFIDTPGHEAFTAMRARGAQVTDIVILIVAANDGVQEQTIESINHAKAADVPIIVAINKTDLPHSAPERIKKDLSEHGLISEEWGGETLFTEISALTGKGVDQLIESVLLQAEVLELKTNPTRGAHGLVIESRLDRSKGAMATVVIQNGVLRVGDYIIAGTAHGRIRAMLDANGKSVTEADTSTPVGVLGLSQVPSAGDPVDVITDIKKAQWIAESRAEKTAADSAAMAQGARSEFLAKMGEAEIAQLDVIIKADVHGGMEAVKTAILKLSSQKANVNVIHASVGGITESDVMLASASKAVIVGFNVRPTGKAKTIAENERIQIRLHTIIYEMLDDLKQILLGMIAPEFEEIIIGKAKVLKAFKISKLGNIAGCSIEEGKITKSCNVRLLRDLAVVWTGKISSLRHYKDDVREVPSGQECGIGLDGYQDVKEGDEIEGFELKEKEVKI
ncbi:MAG: translation initiation factor IF-2 [Pseudomonadota bacterium]